MKKFLAIILVVILALSVVACGGKEPAKTEEGAPAPAKKAALTMGTGGESGTYFAVGGVLANVLNEKNPDVMSVNVVSTGGSADNLQNMAIGVYQLATVQSDVMTYAFNGTRSFEKTGAVPTVRILAGLYAETCRSSPPTPTSRPLRI